MHSDSNSNDAPQTHAVEFRGIRKAYEPGGPLAVADATFSVEKGSFACIVGPSGEGKSTILKLIAGLEQPTGGTLRKPEQVGMVFQGGALLPWLSVF